MPTSAHAPWETRFASLPAAPVLRVRPAAPRPSAVPVTPIAIPVVGSPIPGRHLVRAPWAEPLSAFAGVVVETQQLPESWVRPRTAPERAMDRPIPVAAPTVTAPPERPLVAIPVAAASPIPAAATVAARTVPVRVVPVPITPDPAPARAPRPVPVLTALGTDPAAVARTSAAPIEPVTPSATPSTPAPARRGFVGRAIALTVGLVVTIVAHEAANRLGRR
jgi:hypothetical protein